MGPCHHANWVEVSDPTAYRLIDPGRLRRLVNTLRDPSAQFPQILLCFGGFAKRQALGALFPSLYSLRRESPPGFANIHLDPSQAPLLHPVLLVDCTNGVPLPVRPKGRGCHEDESFDTAWVETEKQTRETVLTRLLFPFVDVVTIFADDLGGLDAAFSLLQRWSCGEPATTLSWKTRPRVCVVTSAAPTWDAHLQQRSFNSRLRAIKAGRHFSSVRLLCLPNGGGTVTWPSNGTRHLRRLLLRDELIKIRRDRQSQRAHFAAHHLAWFFTRAVAHVAKSAREPFDFICTSRVHRPLSACFPRQVSAFVRLAAENHIPCEIVVTVIASSVMLDAFPPGSHRKSCPLLAMTCHVAQRADRFLPARRVHSDLLVGDTPSTGACFCRGRAFGPVGRVEHRYHSLHRTHHRHALRMGRWRRHGRRLGRAAPRREPASHPTTRAVDGGRLERVLHHMPGKRSPAPSDLWSRTLRRMRAALCAATILARVHLPADGVPPLRRTCSTTSYPEAAHRRRAHSQRGRRRRQGCDPSATAEDVANHTGPEAESPGLFRHRVRHQRRFEKTPSTPSRNKPSR